MKRFFFKMEALFDDFIFEYPFAQYWLCSGPQVLLRRTHERGSFKNF